MGESQTVLSWDNLSDQASSLGIGGGGDFFKFEDGENVIRVLSAPVHNKVYFPKDGGNPTYDENASDKMKEEIKESHRFLTYVYSYATKNVCLADFPPSIASAISELSKSSQYKYEGLPPFDLLITKTGAGMSTRYSVIAGRNEEKLSDDIMKDFESKEDLKEYLSKKIKVQANEMENPNATVEEKELAGAKKN